MKDDNTPVIMITSWKTNREVCREFWDFCIHHNIKIYKGGSIGGSDVYWNLVCDWNPRLSWIIVKYSTLIEIKEYTIEYNY